MSITVTLRNKRISTKTFNSLEELKDWTIKSRSKKGNVELFINNYKVCLVPTGKAYIYDLNSRIRYKNNELILDESDMFIFDDKGYVYTRTIGRLFK